MTMSLAEEILKIAEAFATQLDSGASTAKIEKSLSSTEAALAKNPEVEALAKASTIDAAAALSVVALAFGVVRSIRSPLVEMAQQGEQAFAHEVVDVESRAIALRELIVWLCSPDALAAGSDKICARLEAVVDSLEKLLGESLTLIAAQAPITARAGSVDLARNKLRELAHSALSGSILRHLESL